MTSHEGNTPSQEYLSRQQTLERVDAVVQAWDFQTSSPEYSCYFATHTVHWILEQYGQQLKDETWSLDPDAYRAIPGKELPPLLQPLIMQEWKNDLYLSDENDVWLRSAHAYVETDPTIPRYDEIAALPTFKKQLDFAKSQPDILAGLQPTKVEAWPEVQIFFEPDTIKNWGLEFKTSPYNMRVFPFGKAGCTSTATEFSIDNQPRQGTLAKTVCELAILAAKKSYNISDKIPISALENLDARLKGNADIPLRVRDYTPKPRNAIKNLLVEYLLDDKTSNE